MRLTELEEMKNVDIRTVDVRTLEDIDNIEVNKDLPVEQRWKDFTEKARNPFCFVCNGMVVKTSFSDTKESLERRLVQLCVSMDYL